jgi:CRISPR system Cascade subunit CasA
MNEASFNLLTAQWLPLRRRSGVTEWVSPADITSQLATDPFVAPHWGRADLDAATLEFLIALLATALHPVDEEAWRETWLDPPNPERLAEAFEPLEAAFRLDGDGPRFMQEWGGLDGEPSPVSGLFIDAPGANTEKNNADLFQKRGRFHRLGMPAAAIALFTLQSYAPSGGAGHRTSMRGGGPLTTLVRPRAPASAALWHLVWLNVPLVEQPLPQPDGGATVFPWLAKTLTSEKDKSPLDLGAFHPLMSFWWMPRRVRLDVDAGSDSTACDLTGQKGGPAVSSYRTKPWGMNGAAAAHPLSPLYRNKANETEWLFVHPQPGGLPYHLWVDLAFASSGHAATRRPAEIVSHILNARSSYTGKMPRLWAAGYDMDNMKARGFVETTFPLFALPNPAAQSKLGAAARDLVQAATMVARATRAAVKLALNLEQADASRLSALTATFYDQTEAAFFNTVGVMADALDVDANADTSAGRQAFLRLSLTTVALRLFDEAVPLHVLGTRLTEIKRHIRARQGLVLTLSGYGKDGKALFGLLGLDLPGTPAAKPPKTAKTPKEKPVPAMEAQR